MKVQKNWPECDVPGPLWRGKDIEREKRGDRADRPERGMGRGKRRVEGE